MATVPNATPTYPNCPGPGPHTVEGKLFVNTTKAIQLPFACEACWVKLAPNKRGPELPWPPTAR